MRTNSIQTFLSEEDMKPLQVNLVMGLVVLTGVAMCLLRSQPAYSERTPAERVELEQTPGLVTDPATNQSMELLVTQCHFVDMPRNWLVIAGSRARDMGEATVWSGLWWNMLPYPIAPVGEDVSSSVLYEITDRNDGVTQSGYSHQKKYEATATVSFGEKIFDGAKMYVGRVLCTELYRDK
jgi:hypothetical protein